MTAQNSGILRWDGTNTTANLGNVVLASGGRALLNGTLTAVSSGDSGVTWTGSFTPTDDLEDTTNVISVAATLTDLAGNAPLAGNSTNNYAIDTTKPLILSGMSG